MPRELVAETHADEFGVVHIKRDDSWITSYNPAIATCLRSNHDITWIPTNAKAHAYIYYLTNYATKADISPQQILIKAALMAESRKKIIANQDITSNQSSQDPKSLLRWYNSLAHNQKEISGVQIASTLLSLPSHYTNIPNFVHINLSTLRACIQSLFRPETGSANNMADEACFVHVEAKKICNRLDNYRFRGSTLAGFCFFEYCMLVRNCRVRESVSSDCRYDTQHPKYLTEVQRLAKSRSQMRTVSYHGQLL